MELYSNPGWKEPQKIIWSKLKKTPTNPQKDSF